MTRLIPITVSTGFIGYTVLLSIHRARDPVEFLIPEEMNFDWTMLSGIVFGKDIGSGHTETGSLCLWLNRGEITRGPARRS